MKLLGWMHRKFRQNSSEPLRDFVIGQPPTDDQQYFPRANIKPFKQAQRDLHLRKSFTGLEAAKVEDYEDESLVSISEIFPGFLAIGTLGSDQVNNDPTTPKFSISIENITEKETEVTENELKLINDELEKVLEAEAKDDGCNDLSRRNSHVSMGRSSHGSTVTLSGKPLEGPESNVNGTIVCPLQGYLFGSAIELSETTTMAKKENRISLGELFQRSKLAEEIPGAKDDKDEKQAEKEVDKSGMHLIKKKLKKRMLNAASRSSATAVGGLIDAVSAETKLHKILHMFHKKVYPENITAKEKSEKSQKNDKKKKTTMDGVKNNGDQTFTDEDIMIFPKKAILKQTLRRYKSQSNTSQFSINDGDSNWNKEQWIKTDADYLVLEL